MTAAAYLATVCFCRLPMVMRDCRRRPVPSRIVATIARRRLR